MAKSFTLDGTLRLDSRSFNRKLKMATRGATAFGKKLASIGFRSLAVGAAAATAAAVGFGISAARSIAEFGMEMSKVKALTGATGEAFDRLTRKARELGATTAFSASEAAAGMAFLAQAGFKTNDILAASEELLNLAAAGGLELAEAMDIASNIMTPFGMAAAEAGRVADVLALTAGSANTNVAQLGEAFKKVAPISNQLGISFEETAAAIGVLGNSGIQASDAGTALKNIMARLVKPTGEVRQGLKLLGITADEVNPATHSLVEIFETFNKAATVTNDRAKLAAAGVGIFGLRANAAGGVLIQTVGGVKGLNAELLKANGSAKKMADTMLDNLGGDLKIVKSAFEELKLAIGEGGLTSVLREATKWATDLMRSFVESGKALKVGKAIREAADAFRGAFDNSDQAITTLKAGLEYAVTAMIYHMHKGFSGAIGLLAEGTATWWGGMKTQALGWARLIGSALGHAAMSVVGMLQVGFAGIITTFSAGLHFVVQEILIGISQIPGLGKLIMGDDFESKTKSFEEMAQSHFKTISGAIGLEGNKKLVNALEEQMTEAALEVQDGAHAVANWMKGLADGSTKEAARKKFLTEWQKLVDAGLKARIGPEGKVGDAPAVEPGKDVEMNAKGQLILKGQKDERGKHWQDNWKSRLQGSGGLQNSGGLDISQGLEKTTPGAGRGYNQVRRGDAKRKKAAAAAAKKKAEEEKLDRERNGLLQEQNRILKDALGGAPA